LKSDDALNAAPFYVEWAMQKHDTLGLLQPTQNWLARVSELKK
jgi:hypothetical protein